MPNTILHPISTIQLAEGTVLAVNVPPSIHLVALWHRNGPKEHCIEYVYRTNHGKEWMNPDAAERHLMDGSRATKLAVKELFSREDLRNKNLAIVPSPISRSITRSGEGGRGIAFARGTIAEKSLESIARLVSVEETELDIRLDGENITIPYAFIEATWVTTDSRPAIGLKMRIVKGLDGLSLEPIEPLRDPGML